MKEHKRTCCVKELPPRFWTIGFCLFVSGTGAGMLMADGVSWERALLFMGWLGVALFTWRER